MIDFEFDFRYEGEKIPALKNVQGEIGNGKCIVLCGGSGCGKSTLLRCINHLIPQFYEGNLKGFCRIQGRDTGELSVGEVGRLAASVFQDPRSQFFTINSTTEVAFGMENHGVPREEMVEKVEAAFGLFSLEKLKDRNVYELSSGERQLISILSAWAVDTDVLLLDEPTANLDFAAIKQLRELLLKLKGQGKTLILSEHRLYYLSGIADEYWLMEGGRLKGCYPEEGIKAMMKIIGEMRLNVNLLSKLIGNIDVSLKNFVKSVFSEVLASEQIEILTERESPEIVALYYSAQFGVFLLQAHHTRPCEHNLKSWTLVVALAKLAAPILLFEHLVDQQNLTSARVEIGCKVGYATSLEVEVVHVHIQAAAVVGSKVLLGVLQQKRGLSNTTSTLNANKAVVPVDLVHEISSNWSVRMLNEVFVCLEESFHFLCDCCLTLQR